MLSRVHQPLSHHQQQDQQLYYYSFQELRGIVPMASCCVCGFVSSYSLPLANSNRRGSFPWCTNWCPVRERRSLSSSVSSSLWRPTNWLNVGPHPTGSQPLALFNSNELAIWRSETSSSSSETSPCHYLYDSISPSLRSDVSTDHTSSFTSLLPLSVKKEEINRENTFILHLEPGRDTLLHDHLQSLRDQAAVSFGADDSYCYRVHCTVTGFFNCDDLDVFMNKLIHLATYLRHHQPPVQQQQQQQQQPRVISTDDGYVLLPIKCLSLSPGFLHTLLRDTIDSLRIKQMDHVTLAASRHDPQLRHNISHFYNQQLALLDEEVFCCPWDLVFYKLERRSEGFYSQGMHAFNEIRRFRGLAPRILFSPPQARGDRH